MNIDKEKNNYKSLVVLLLAIVIFIDNVGDTAVNIALPAIVSSFNTNSSFFMQCFIGGYLIIAASTLVFFGKIADLIGIKKMFTTGIALLFITSTIIGMSSNVALVLGSRLVQGMAFSLTYPLVITLGRINFPSHQQGLLMGLVSLFSSLSLALGPLITGFLLQFSSWRYIFLINLPLTIITLFISIFFIKDKEKEKNKQNLNLNFIGALLYTISIIFLFLSILNSNKTSLDFKIVFSILSFLFFIIFLKSQKKLINPLFDTEIIKNSVYKTGSLIRFLGQAVIFSSFFVFSISFQNIYAFSSLEIGLIFLSITLSIALFSLISGKLIDKTDPFRVLKFGIVFMIIACLLFLNLHQTSSNKEIITPMIIMGVGIAFFLPSINAITLNAIPFGKEGIGTGIYFTIVTLAGAFGTVISNELLSVKSTNYIKKTFLDSQFKINHFQLENLLDIIAARKSISLLPQLNINIANEFLYPLVYQSFFSGLRIVLWFWLMLLSSTFILCFFLERIKLVD